MRTQHDMKCVGLGLPEGSALRYAASLTFPETTATQDGFNFNVIGGLKATLDAKSEEAATEILSKAWPYGTITSLELL